MTRPALTSSPVTRLRQFTIATITACIIGSATLGVSSGSLAQSDGTGADSRGEPSECVVVRADARPSLHSEIATPDASPATPAAATPEAATPIPSTPQASPVLTDNASPQASPSTNIATPVPDLDGTPAASPVVEPTVQADPNDQVMADLTSTVESLFSCLNDREFDIYASITSDAWHGYLFGIGDPLTAGEFAEFAPILPETETALVAATNLQIVDETTVTIDVIYTTESQQWAGTWTFDHSRVAGLPTWVLQSETPLANSAPENAAAITVTMLDSSYTLAPDAVAGPNVVLRLNNTTDRDHEALVLQLDEGVSTSDLLQSTSGTLPEGAALVGQATVAPGTSGDMVLVGLEPGEYTIVDLLPDENGLPNLSSGMETSFTVEN